MMDARVFLLAAAACAYACGGQTVSAEPPTERTEQPADGGQVDSPANDAGFDASENGALSRAIDKWLSERLTSSGCSRIEPMSWRQGCGEIPCYWGTIEDAPLPVTVTVLMVYEQPSPTPIETGANVHFGSSLPPTLGSLHFEGTVDHVHDSDAGYAPLALTITSSNLHEVGGVRCIEIAPGPYDVLGRDK